jgi:hypothetical protein
MSLQNGPSRPLKATNLKASLRLQPTGLERFSLTFDGVQAQGEQGWSVGGGQLHVVTDPQDTSRLALRGDLADVKIGKPLEGPSAILGQTVNRVMIAGPISQGPVLLSKPENWNAAGGKLTIMAGELLWGPIAFTEASGEMTLTGAQKWQGDVRGTGALKPDGVAVAALSGPVNLAISDNKLSLNGLPGINISNAFGNGE